MRFSLQVMFICVTVVAVFIFTAVKVRDAVHSYLVKEHYRYCQYPEEVELAWAITYARCAMLVHPSSCETPVLERRVEDIQGLLESKKYILLGEELSLGDVVMLPSH